MTFVGKVENICLEMLQVSELLVSDTRLKRHLVGTM